MIDIKQVKKDSENGVILGRITIAAVIDLALVTTQIVAPVCPTCCNTGEANGHGQLDCPDCDSAMERAAFNKAYAEFFKTRTPEDLAWDAYQDGKHRREQEILVLIEK